MDIIIRGAFVRWLKRPTASDPNSGFALCRLEDSGQMVDTKISGPFSPMIQDGEWFVAEGEWRASVFKDKNENVFRAKSIRPDLPVTAIGAKNLFSKTFSPDGHGITPKAVVAFVDKHGAKSALLAEDNPNLLLQMSSNPNAFGTAILKAWSKRISGRHAIRVMEKAKVSDVAVRAILNRHKDSANDLINKNPYAFALIRNVGFLEADKIGTFVGIGRDDMRRVVAAVSDIIGNDMGGHTYTPFADVKNGVGRHGINFETLRELLNVNTLDSGFFIGADGGAIIAQKVDLFKYEKRIADQIGQLLERGRKTRKAHVDAVTNSVLSSEKYKHFDEIQRSAVKMAVRESVSILTGGPGTGKSTVSEAIAEIAAATNEGPVILMAPTATAAKRLEETTGRPASTVHKALEAVGEGGQGFMRHARNPLPAGCFVVVDETSMLDTEIAAALLDALPEDGRILFVGDRNQIASVGAGYVLGDMIASVAPNGNRVPSTELQNVYRNAAGSMIPVYAAKIRQGTFEADRLDNFMRGGVMFYDYNKGAIARHVVKLMTELIPNSLKLDPRKQVAILCPQRTGAGGTYQINAALQQALNSKGLPIEGLVHAAGEDTRQPLPRVGDRVMQTRNDYENGVMNGDVATIDSTFMDTSGKAPVKKVRVKFDSGKVVSYTLAKCRELILAYAITGHKSQGSQYPCVIMPISPDHADMLDRTLVYTEWTRAKEYLILVGDKETFANSLTRTESSQRRTRLKAHLEKTLAGVPTADGIDLSNHEFEEAEDYVAAPAPPLPPMLRGKTPIEPARPPAPAVPFRTFRTAPPPARTVDDEEETHLPTP